MPQAPAPLQSQEDALALHQRLLAHDPTASDELADAYLGPLIVWLGKIAPHVSEEIRIEAAEDAILSLIRNPQSYSPARQTLEVYLRMSGRGDMLNALASEERRKKHESPCGRVELLADDGKYMGRDDDPALPLRLAEETRSSASAIPDALRRRLPETDLRAMQLLLEGERRYAVFAELYGLLHLPGKEQTRTVKRHKDRLKKMLQREGGKL
jgi:RNA polymerase sigma-70 factor (ECF subfamily)